MTGIAGQLLWKGILEEAPAPPTHSVLTGGCEWQPKKMFCSEGSQGLPAWGWRAGLVWNLLRTSWSSRWAGGQCVPAATDKVAGALGGEGLGAGVRCPDLWRRAAGLGRQKGQTA